MTTMPPELRALRGLMTTPPSEFVAERNRLVKQLRSDGQRDVAQALAKLRRPTVIDWALNVAARDHPDDINGFVDAAGEVQQAQSAAIDGQPGGDVRSTMRVLREQTAQVVKLVAAIAAGSDRPGNATDPAPVTTRLAEVAGSGQACAMARVGLLGVEDTAVGELLDGILPAMPAAAPAAARDPGGSTDASAGERRAHMRALADAQRAHERASSRLSEADREVARQEASVEKTRAQLDQAQASLDAAVAGLDAAARRRQEAAAQADAAHAQVHAAQELVDDDRDAPM